MEKFERLLPKGTSYPKVHQVWRAWNKKVKTYAIHILNGFFFRYLKKIAPTYRAIH